MKQFFSLILLFVTPLVWAQQDAVVDFKRVTANLAPDIADNSIVGSLHYEFYVLQDTDSIYLDAYIDKLISFNTEQNITASTAANKLWMQADFKANTAYAVDFVYFTKPKQTLYFFDNQFWTQGQGKYTSRWFPSLDYMTDKLEFDLTVVMPQEFTVIANGELTSKKQQDGLISWEFDMQQPMSSYLVMIAGGIYSKQALKSKSGVVLENYYYPEDSLKVEPTYRYTKQIFDFFEQKIGVPYPWQNYKQLPVRDFLYAGMENTTATVFSEAFVTDSIGFLDRNYINVNAHELAHQWFGNLVTEVSSESHWLHEGFATYYALLAEREIFGDDYYYWKLYQSAEQLKELSEQGKGEALNNPRASSLTFYEKGAWALHILNEQVGAMYFDKAVKTYLERFAYKNVTIADFLTVVEEVAATNLTEFRANWINQTAFKSQEALTSLTKNDGIIAYFKAQSLRNQSWEVKQKQLFKLLEAKNEYVAQEAVYQLADGPLNESLAGYSKALASENLIVRQAVAVNLAKVPLAIRSEYESLLEDKSYVTREAALYNLWNTYPENQSVYLNKTKAYQGFQNKNLRQLWLVLALVTATYEPDKKGDFLIELMDYASDIYSFEVRELALNYLFDLNVVNAVSLAHLVNACVHPNWRFRSQARNILERVAGNPISKDILEELAPNLPQAQQDYLNKTVLK